MIQGSKLNRDTTLKYLSEGVCKIYFKKVTDGRFRSLYCSLRMNLLPRSQRKYVETIFSPFNKKDIDIIPVYDIVSGDWKSFRLSNVIHLYTTEELLESKSELEKIRTLKNEY
jgi:hypothetical protein